MDNQQYQVVPERLDDNGNVTQAFYHYVLGCCADGIVVCVDIPGYEGIYSISNFGVIKSYTRTINCANNGKREIKGSVKGKYLTNKGYYLVDLQKYDIRERFLIHRLMACLFIPNPDNKPEINHKDSDRKNYALYNLEWNTRKENMCHARDNGRLNPHNKGKFGKDNIKSKPISQFTKSGEYVRDFSAIHEAHRLTGISYGAIGNVCRGEQPSAGGYIWKFKKIGA